MAAYYKVEVSLNTNSVTVGSPSAQEVLVTLPLVGPAGATGTTGATGATGPAGSGIEILTAQGDLLYRGASVGERLPIGTSGQVLKVSGGIPAWGAESGAVSSVAGRTGAVTLAVADVSGAQPTINFSNRKIIYVSKGTAATDTRGTLSKYDSTVPFATISAAQSVASAGDVIAIESGTYSETDLGKNGISYWFAPNCIVSGSSAASNNGLFADNNVAMSFSIYGYPKLIDSGAGGGRGIGLIIQNAASTLYAELQSVEVTGGDILVGLYLEEGSGTIIVRESVVCEGYDALLVSGGVWTVCANSFEATAAIADGGNAVEIDGGQSTVFASKGIFSSGSASIGGSTGSSSAVVVLSGSCFVQSPLIKSDADTTVSVQAGSVKIVGAKIEASSTLSALVVASGATATIDSCELVSGSSATNGIGGSGTVFASTLRTNKPVASGVSLNLSTPTASTTTPAALGTAAVGTGATFARADHVHSADLSDSAFRVSGSSDSTKKLAFELDTLVDAATTRTLTIANRSGVNVVSDTSAGTGSDVVNNIVSLTQAEYNAIGSPDAATLFLITNP